MVQTYITNPMVIQAVQWCGENEDEIKEFIGSEFIEFTNSEFVFNGYSGTITLPMGSWLLLNPAGFIVVPDEVFRVGFTAVDKILK